MNIRIEVSQLTLNGDAIRKCCSSTPTLNFAMAPSVRYIIYQKLNKISIYKTLSYLPITLNLMHRLGKLFGCLLAELSLTITCSEIV